MISAPRSITRVLDRGKSVGIDCRGMFPTSVTPVEFRSVFYIFLLLRTPLGFHEVFECQREMFS